VTIEIDSIVRSYHQKKRRVKGMKAVELKHRKATKGSPLSVVSKDTFFFLFRSLGER
jgi:hypothetical protein